MSLLLALQGPPDITGSGVSSFGFTDAGNALEIFEGSGASSFAFIDAGTGIVFIDIVGSGASDIILIDTGTGVVAVEPETQPNGGGWVYRDRDRGKTVRAFQRLLQPKPPERKQRPERKKQQEIFAYVSGSEIQFTDAGHGKVIAATVGAGASSFRLVGQGRGSFEESAADIIRLLLAMDEI